MVVVGVFVVVDSVAVDIVFVVVDAVAVDVVALESPLVQPAEKRTDR